MEGSDAGAVMGWSGARWQSRLRLRSGSLGRGHRGRAGSDSLQGSPASQTCPCGDHGIHMLHTASTPAPWWCEPVPCWRGLTWGTDSCSGFSGSHMSVSSGFLPTFWKWKPSKGSACRQKECWEQPVALTTSPHSALPLHFACRWRRCCFCPARCLCSSLTTGCSSP